MTDPEFLDDAKKARLDVDGPMTGQELEEFLAQANKTPPAAAKRINDIFNAYTEQK